MKTITINKRSRVMNLLLEMARQEDLLLRTSEGDEFMLLVIDDFEHEVVKQRANKKLMSFLDNRFRQGRQEKGIPLEEVARKLGLVSNDAKIPRRQAGSHSR